MLQSETVRKYDTYKDSGIEWIGEIPTSWQKVRLRFLCNIQTGDKDTVNKIDDGVYPFYVRSPIVERINTYTFDGEAILTAGDGVGAGKVFHYVTGKFDYHQRVYNLHNFKMIYGKLLYHYLKENFYKEIEKSNAKSTVDSIRLPMLLDFPVVFPKNIEEQQEIADYLDKKCGEIDRVVETEKSVIEKLKEYKQSIITEAATKGLDKSVPLKDSGIEWIGKIPQHWDVLSLARIANIVRGASPRPAGDPMYFCGNFCPWITVAEVTKDDSKYIFETEEYLTELGVQHSKLIDENTFLLSNSGATLGVPKITKIKGCINDGSLAFLDISCNMDYLYYVLKSRTNEFRKQMQGYGQPNLNTTIVKAFKICLPSTNEQIQIAEYLDKKCSEIDKAIANKEQVIEKFTEYKKSLIYECVTGKRKVVK